MASLDTVQSPFDRLRVLIGDTPPGDDPIDLTVGEPRHEMPDFLVAKLTEVADQFARYPLIGGSDDVRVAICWWHERRYGISLDPGRNVIISSGSRDGLVTAVLPAIKGRADEGKRAVLIPNPFYQCYAAGAVIAGGEPVYLPADAEAGFLPDIDNLAKDRELLRRTAAYYLCSPSNPQGAVASPDYLAKAITLARQHDFMLFADECYSEVYSGAPPPGALEIALNETGSLANVVAFNSLSKRSNLPGLRSGFCAGDPDFLEIFERFRNVSAPQVPLPVQHASAAIWDDERHVEASRALYQAKFGLADELLGNRFGYRRPAGGFFLWLEMGQMGGGEAATVTLWKRSGVKVLPGAYLTHASSDAKSPGEPFVRVALVEDLATTRRALERIAQFDS